MYLPFVTDTAARIAARRPGGATAVGHVVDIGSGPGVGSCELAHRFPAATVTAVDSSPAMLARAAARAAEAGLADRIVTRVAELPDGLEGLAPADVIWASMSLHHVGDEVAALRVLRGLLAPGGVLAVAEFGDPTRMLPADLGIGRPGLADRIEAAMAGWFAAMRVGLPGSAPSAGLGAMLEAAGFEIVDDRLARLDFAPPLGDDARRAVLGTLERTRHQLADALDAEDRTTLDVLVDADDPRSVMRRDDVFLEASQQIVVARVVAGV